MRHNLGNIWRKGRTERTAILVALMVAVPGLTSCGSSRSHNGASSATASPTGRKTAGALSGATYKFGAITSETGPDSSSLAPAAGAFKAWEKYTNAHGGINGHPVQVIVLDDKGTAAVSLSDAHQLIDGDHVIAISNWGTGGGSAPANWGPYATQKGIPMIGSDLIAVWGTTIGHPNVYQTSTYNLDQWVLTNQLAKDVGGTKLDLIGNVAEHGCTLTPIFEMGAKLAGIQFGGCVNVGETQPSYVAECLTLKQAGVTSVVSVISAQPFQAMMDQCYQQGYHPTIIAFGPELTPQYLKDPALANTAAVIAYFPFWDTSRPAIAAFTQAINQYAPSALQTAPMTAASVWGNMAVFGAAAAAGNLGNDPTPAALTAGLQTINGDTFGGLTVPLTYTNGGNEMPPGCAYSAKVENGAFVTLMGGKPLCVSNAVSAAAFKLYP